MSKEADFKQIKNRLKKLAELINKHNIHYHQNDKPIISDREFDKLVIENSSLEKKYPKLKLKNGPNQKVGGKLKKKFKKIQHKSQMLSLANAFNEEDLINSVHRIMSLTVDERKKMGERARERIKRLHPDFKAKELLELYNRVIG